MLLNPIKDFWKVFGPAKFEISIKAPPTACPTYADEKGLVLSLELKFAVFSASFGVDLQL